ncbi:GAP family protein [Gordonia neofelifaecis]|uniref:GAP family protein n=1 Tax=Gordonia neofelifaecis NRRL B-59395 TaxID=644548 RepID=F1YNN9_9ACTN|nr:GAP family protein [Gordonia neofelifaecis]EGD53649.1 hypothetical protein SCNU_17692 [Gordonia neofelifaecis NRRL B-59395]
MGAVIGDLLPMAVGVAISPIPIIAAILMLLGKHARTTSLGFAAGWIIGVVAATAIFTTVGSAASGSSTAVGWVKLVLGVLLLAEGVREWRARSGPASTPKWMKAIDEMKAPAGAGIGFVLAAVNPKNLMLCIAAGMQIGAASLSTGDDIVAIVVFSLIASSTVVVPVLAYQVAADRLRGPLDSLKAWLEANNKTVMAVLILVIGVVLIGKGIGGVA